MQIPLYQIDAFAERVFEGNPAAVCPLDRWLDDAVMQAIAAENNLSETAFFVPRSDNSAELRWFTPRGAGTANGFSAAPQRTLRSAGRARRRARRPARIVIS